MKKYRKGMLLVQSLFSYMLVIFVLLLSIDMLQNIITQSVNQKRSLVAHQVLKEQISHMKQGETVGHMILFDPFQMEIEHVNERICVSYEDGNKKRQSVCSP